MDRDFHYYGTFLAAAVAGFDNKQARQIATSAQFIDDCTENLSHSFGWLQGGWNANVYKVRMSEEELVKFHPIVTSVYGVTTWSPTSNYDETRQIWMPFHFLPGNFKVQDSKMLESVGKTNPEEDLRVDSSESIQILCRPRSDSVQNMINFARSAYKEIKKSDEEMAMMLVGCVMHVFADTYAHQDFAGTTSYKLNGTKNGITTNPGRFTNYGRWQGAEWIPDEATYRDIDWPKDVATTDWLNIYPPPVFGAIKTSALGHGQMGHLPDVSTIAFKYQPAWSSKEITRNNPQQFMNAFIDMSLALKCILNDSEFDWNNKNARTEHIANVSKGRAFPIVQQLICPDNKDVIDTKIYDKGLKVPGDQWFLYSEQRWSNALDDLLNGNDYNPVPGYNEAKYGWPAEAKAWLNEEVPLEIFKALKFIKWNVTAKLLFRQHYGQLRCMGNGIGRIVRNGDLSRTMDPRCALEDEFTKFWHPGNQLVADQNMAIWSAKNSDELDDALLNIYKNPSNSPTISGDWMLLKSGDKYISYSENARISVGAARESFIPKVCAGEKCARPFMLIKSNEEDSYYIRTLENRTGKYLFLEYPESKISKTLWYNTFAESSNQRWKMIQSQKGENEFVLESERYPEWYLGIDGTTVKAVNRSRIWTKEIFRAPPLFEIITKQADAQLSGQPGCSYSL